MSRFANLSAFPTSRPAAVSVTTPASPIHALGPGSVSNLRIPPILPSDRAWDHAANSRVRKVGFYFVLAFVFVRFSLLSEVFTYGMGFKPYLVIILGPPAVFLALMSGGLPRLIRCRPAWFWLGFMFWLLIASPFSSWLGGTVRLLVPAFATEFSMFFMVAGLALTLSECRHLCYAMAFGGAIDALLSRLAGSAETGRLSIAWGTLQNPNDYATHLLVTLPFLLLVSFSGRPFARMFAALTVLFGVYVILLTGSRGAFLAVAVLMVFIVIRASLWQRVVMLTSVLLVGILAIALLPQLVLMRYMTVFSNVQSLERTTYDEYLAAEGSQAARQRLLRSSLSLTLQHPLVGVGPGQFSVSEADMARSQGRRGAWQVTHNSYTEVSSEAGIPALILLLATISGCFYQLNSVYRRARLNQSLTFIRDTSFCIMLCLVGFAVCIFFASMAYRFYLPTLVALTVTFVAAARHEFAAVKR